MSLINELYYLLALAGEENEPNRIAHSIAHSEEYKNLFYKLEDALIKAEIGENKAKAFDVIKEKYVDMFELKCCSSPKEYNNCISFKIGFIKNYELTEEEFNLLKEVLNNDK